MCCLEPLTPAVQTTQEPRYVPNHLSIQNRLTYANHPGECFTLQNLTTIPPSVDVYFWLRYCRHRYLRHLPITRRKGPHMITLLLISGIEPNPGPRRPKFPCSMCSKACKLNSIACDDCNQWLHKECLGMSTTEFSRLGKSDDTWNCPSCQKPNNSTKIYSIPEDSFDHSLKSINLSAHPSMIDSISDVSMQSRSSVSSETTSHLSTQSHSTSSVQSIASPLNNKPNAPIMASSPKPAPKEHRNRKSLRLLTINFQSLRNKGKLLEAIIDDTEPDIILGTETWLDESIKSSEILPNYLGYDVQRRDRKSDEHGGVLIAARRDLQLGNISRSDSTELISGTVSLSNQKKMTVAAYYRPPNRVDEEYINNTMEEISKLKSRCKRNVLVMGGDFNLPDINWVDLTITGNQNPTRVNQSFLDIIADNGLEQQVDFPTRKDKQLDLILTTHPSYKQRCKPLPSIGNSDHDIVLYDTTFAAHRPKPERRKIYLWKRADISGIKQDISNFGDTFKKSVFNDIDSMWNSFTSTIQDTMERRVPTKMTMARYTHPWMNRKIKKTIRRKQRAHRKARKTARKRDRDRYRRLQQEVQFSIRRANREYMQDASSNFKENPKKFWSFIKSRGQEASGVATLKNKNGYLKSDKTSKAENLNEQFQSVYTREDTSSITDKGRSPNPSMTNITVTCNGIFKLLKNLKSSKATGPDSIPAFILKEAAQELAPILTLIFQRSLDTGIVPEEWRKAWIVPIYKKGDKHLPGNYRPVSLTSITCKVLEHVIHSSIMSHFDQHNILCDNQHGFRKKRPCETQLIVTIQDIAKNLSKGRQVDIILLDFAKAFDKVPHARLLHKLDFYSVRGNINKWISSFLGDRKQQVLLENCHSSSAEVLSGVPQGTVLGPLLFLAYINDLPEVTKSSNARIFADDTLLFRPITNQHDSDLLQQDLTALEEWVRMWQMDFNASKCSVIYILPSKRKHVIDSSYTLHGQTLETVEESKYLRQFDLDKTHRECYRKRK